MSENYIWERYFCACGRGDPVLKRRVRVADNMSQRKGGRGQKYQNSTAFKPGLYGESRRVKLAAALPVAGVCARCRDKVEWKKKYDKYKPLTVPRKCVVCQQKKVKQAYYRLCQVCAESSGVCAKCGEQGEIVTRWVYEKLHALQLVNICLHSFPPSKKAQAQEEEEFKQGLKFMSERERSKNL